MAGFVDAVILIPVFDQLIEYMQNHFPESLQRDDEGELVVPPVIDGFARTPAAINGNSVLVYARFRQHEIEEWRGTPGIEVLGEAPFAGPGTASVVYQQIWDSPDKLAKYDSVYNRWLRYTDPETKEEVEEERPWFGILAGAE